MVKSLEGSEARTVMSATSSNIQSTSFHLDFSSWKSWVQVLVRLPLIETLEELMVAGRSPCGLSLVPVKI